LPGFEPALEDPSAMNKRSGLILAAIALLVAAPAFASGFGFYEQGAKASGQAGAWVARADDASANWYNPAALVNLSGREVQFGFNYLQPGNDTQFSPAGSGGKIDAVSNGSAPAHFYFSQRISDKLAWGVGLNNPFGLITEWDSPVITPFSKRAELRTYLLNPNVAFKLGNFWSVAIGADYVSTEVREFAFEPVPNVTANLTGEGDAWGYNFAIQYKNEYFSIAGQYRSELRNRIDGNVTVTQPLSFLNSAATTDIDLPGQTLLGMAWTGKRFDIEVGAYYTQWNYFKSLDVTFSNPLTPAITQIENWEGTWSYRLGLALRLGPEMKHEVRIGGVFDESPIPAQYLRPSIPDADRTGFSLGYGYQGKSWGVDIYELYLEFANGVANGSPADGVIPGTYTTNVLVAGVTAKYRF
jgi:long-chain fatty acid transport protein